MCLLGVVSGDEESIPEEYEDDINEDYNINVNMDGKEINSDYINSKNCCKIRDFDDIKTDALAALSLVDSDDEENYLTNEGISNI